MKKCGGAIDDEIRVMIYQHWHQKSYGAPGFNHLDTTNKMVPLTVSSVSCGTDTVPTASHNQVSHYTFFSCHHLINEMLPLIILFTSHGSSAGPDDIT